MTREIINFPFEHTETDYDASLVAAFSVMRYLGYAMTRAGAVKLWKWREGKLSQDLPLSHKKVWRKLRKRIYFYKATPEFIKNCLLTYYKPIAALLQVGFCAFRWVVITGYDNKGRLIVSDGTGRRSYDQDRMNTLFYDWHLMGWLLGLNQLVYVTEKVDNAKTRGFVWWMKQKLLKVLLMFMPRLNG